MLCCVISHVAVIATLHCYGHIGALHTHTRAVPVLLLQELLLFFLKIFMYICSSIKNLKVVLCIYNFFLGGGGGGFDQMELNGSP